MSLIGEDIRQFLPKGGQGGLPPIDDDLEVSKLADELMAEFEKKSKLPPIDEDPEVSKLADELMAEFEKKSKLPPIDEDPEVSKLADELMAERERQIARSEHGNNAAIDLSGMERDPLNLGRAAGNAYTQYRKQQGEMDLKDAGVLSYDIGKAQTVPLHEISKIRGMTPAEQQIALLARVAESEGDPEEAKRLWDALRGRQQALESSGDKLVREGESRYIKYQQPESEFWKQVLNTVESSGMTVASGLRSGAAWALGGPALGGLMSLLNTVTEASTEAGGAYAEGKRRGMSPEQIRDVAEKTQDRNVALLLASNTLGDWATFGIDKGLGKLAQKITGKGILSSLARGMTQTGVPYLAGALPEGGEEFGQEIITQTALGDAPDYQKALEAAKAGVFGGLLYPLVGRGAMGMLNMAMRGSGTKNIGDTGETPSPLQPSPKKDISQAQNFDEILDALGDESFSVEDMPDDMGDNQGGGPVVLKGDALPTTVIGGDTEPKLATPAVNVSPVMSGTPIKVDGTVVDDGSAAPVAPVGQKQTRSPGGILASLMSGKTDAAPVVVAPEQVIPVVAPQPQQGSEDVAEIVKNAADVMAKAQGNEAAPVVRPEAPVVEPASDVPTPGKDSIVRYRENGDLKETPVRYEIVEVDDLKTSRSEGYPKELQPRDTDKAISDYRVGTMAADLKAELLGFDDFPDRGAPTAKEDGVVVAGNHRTWAVDRAYDAKTEGAQRYREYLVGPVAQELGDNPERIMGMKKPVLVRKLQDGSVNLRAFAEDANASVVGDMGASEQAKMDADKISDAMLDTFDVDEAGEINRDFVESFAKNIVRETEMGRFLDKDGQLSQDGIRRIRNALVTCAYGDPALVGRISESTDDNAKRISNGLMAAAPVIARMEGRIEKGLLHPLSIRQDLMDAVKLVHTARSEGRNIEEYLTDQTSLFDQKGHSEETKALARFLYSNKASTKAVREFLTRYAQNVERLGAPNEQALPGTESDVPTKRDLVSRLLGVQTEGQRESAGLFDGVDEKPVKRPDKQAVAKIREEIRNKTKAQIRAEYGDEIAAKNGLDATANAIAEKKANDLVAPLAEEPKRSQTQEPETPAVSGMEKNRTDAPARVPFGKMTGKMLADEEAAIRDAKVGELIAAGESRERAEAEATVYARAARVAATKRRMSPLEWERTHGAMETKKMPASLPQDVDSKNLVAGAVAGTGIMKKSPGSGGEGFDSPEATRQEPTRTRPKTGAEDSNGNIALPEERGKAADSGEGNAGKVAEENPSGMADREATAAGENEKVSYRLAKDRDAEYMQAVETGDMETAQRMVDKAASAAGFVVQNVHHGTKRIDRIGNRMDPKRATSGPMPFFTDDPDIAENYSKGKNDNSLEIPDSFDAWFKVKIGKGKPKNISDAWYYMTTEQRRKINSLLPHVVNVDENGDVTDGFRVDKERYGVTSGDHWEYTIKENRGNTLKAAVDIWLNSGAIFDLEEGFVEILRLGGVENVTFESPWKEVPGVVDAHLMIRNPVDTSNINADVFDALVAASKGKRASQKYGVDHWDKRSLSGKQWIDGLKQDMNDGTTYAWTSVPDWVTKVLIDRGYDGIKDTGGKYTGNSHTVWIPFFPWQVKRSAPVTYDGNGNIIPLSQRFNAGSEDIRYSAGMRGSEHPVTLEGLRRSVPGAKIADLGDGKYRIDLHNGESIVVSTVKEIPMDPDVVRRDYGREPAAGEVVAGASRTIDGRRFIELAEGIAGEGTLDHEIFETARDMVLTAEEKDILDREIGSTEAQAEAYREFQANRKGAMTGRIVRVFQKLKDFFGAIRSRLFGKNSADIFREIAQGKVWGREARGTGAGAYSLGAEAEAGLNEDSAKFGRAVDAFVAGNLNPRQPIPVMTTPLALHLAGADVVPMTINHDTMKKVLVDHNLSRSMLKKIPFAMADPVMVFQSDSRADSIVVLLEIRDPKRGSVVVPVALNRVIDSDGTTVNQMTSVYFREKSSGKPQDEWIISQIEKGNLRYIDKQKSSAWDTLSGQKLSDGTNLSTWMRKQNFSTQNIHTEEDLVKAREQSRTRYSLTQKPSGATQEWEKVRDKSGLERVNDLEERTMSSMDRIKAAKQWWDMEMMDDISAVKKYFGEEVYMRVVNALHGINSRAQALIEFGDKEHGVRSLYDIFGSLPAEEHEGLMHYCVFRHLLDISGSSEGAERLMAPLKQSAKEATEKAKELETTMPTDEFHHRRLLDDAKKARKTAQNYEEQVADLQLQIKTTRGKASQYRAAVARLEELYPHWKQAQQDLVGFSRHLLEKQRDAGVVSDELYSLLTQKYPNYIPLQRDFGPDGDLEGSMIRSKGIVNLLSPIKRLKGSKRNVIDPLYQIVANAYTVEGLVGKQAAAREIVRMVDRGDYEGLIDPTDTPWSKPGEYVFHVWEGGKKRYFRTTPDIYMALVMSTAPNIDGVLAKIIQAPVKALREGVTHGPGFILRNPIRDTIMAGVVGEHFVPFVDTLRGVFHVWKQDAVFEEFMRSGAMQGLAHLDPKSRKRMAEMIRAGKGTERLTDELRNPPRALWRALGAASALSELGTRVGQYQKVRQYGGSMERAAFVSRDILNYMRGGRTSKQISKYVPFFNASVQGVSKGLRAIYHDGKVDAGTLARGVLYITVPSLLTTIWNLSDDDRRKKYLALPAWRRNLFWNIFVGEHHFMIPKPFELGVVFGSIPERFADWLFANDRKAFDGMATSLYNAVMPEYMPLFFSLPLELNANYSTFYERNIVPLSQTRLVPKLQYGAYTSEWAKWAGEKFGLSPRKLEYAVLQLTGGSGKDVSNLADKAFRAVEDETRPARDWYEETPGVSSFVSRARMGQRWTQMFADEREEIDTLFRSAKQIYENSGRGALTLQERRILGAENGIRQVNQLFTNKGGIDDLRREISKVTIAKGMSAEEKRARVDRLEAKIGDLSERGLAYIDRIRKSMNRGE